MLKVQAILLGALVLFAGCTSPREETIATPGEECLLGGPPRAPTGNRTAFNLTERHIRDHPALEEVFSDLSHLTAVTCEEGAELMAHLAEEGANVEDGRREFDQNVYLRYNGTTLWVSLQAQP